MPQVAFKNNDEAVALLKERGVKPSGFSSFLGVEPTVCWEGVAELHVQVTANMTQHHGFAHGGIIGFMADNAMAWAAASVAGDVVTGSYNISFLTPARGSLLRARGEVLKAGKRQVIARADVWSEEDGAEPVLVAVAQGTIIPVGKPAADEAA